MGIANKLANIFRRQRIQQETDEELAFHLEERTRENMRTGLTEEQARLAAKRRVGNLTRLREDAMESDLIGWLDALRRETLLALRSIRRAPLFAAVTILSLTLGIGANTIVFTVMKRVLLDSLPVSNADRLVILHAIGRQEGHTSDDGMKSSFSYPQYQDLSAATRPVFSGILARLKARATLEGRQSSERVTAELVSGNYFSLLGVKPWRGRLLTPRDNQIKGGHPLAVLGYRAWQRLFGGDPAILNQTIRLNSCPYTVVGIAPPAFYGIRMDSPPDVYVPMMMKAQITPTWDGLYDRLDHWAGLVGLLRPGVTAEQAQKALSVIYPPIRDLDLAVMKHPPAEFRRGFARNHIELSNGGQGYAQIRSELEKPLRFLTVMVIIVLLITIINVANLLIARSAARERDMAVRLSIGAGKAVLIRQILAESILLATMGGILGVLLAYTTTPVLLKLLSTDLSESSINAHPDTTILATMACITFFSAIAFGLFPALQSTRVDPSVALKSEGSGGHTGGSLWLRKVLVGGQITFSMLLLTGALLFTRSLKNLQHVNPGFRTEHIVSFKVDPSSAGYTQSRIQIFTEDLLSRLRELHFGKHVTVATSPLLEEDYWGSDVTVEGSRVGGSDQQHVLRDAVSPGYFETLRLPLLLGRTFENQDARSKVVVVNNTFVEHFLPGQNPVGRHLTFSTGDVKLDWTIVGVVADSQHAALREQVEPFVWKPYLTESKLNALTFYLDSDGRDTQLLEQIRKTLHQLDPGLPVYDLRTMQDVVSNRLFAERALARLSNIFAELAILLAVIGLYGVMGYSVARRQREFGIRMAVGATPRNVLLMVLRETALIGGISLLCALPLVLASGGLVRSALFGVQPNDPILCTIAALILFSVAILAGFIPARHASRIDPQVALRSS